ncbi:DUF3298 domain-containing protein [Paenibacillus sp. GD4]|jgi:hypothetical protein|uniref:DUF3298 and DUF4163 domain-containing protein n=1 Tax=Paenibacillus sp. GD4 TaxID=3068890 RepID=UPI002796717F|nr:DUF3298 and DUF4163 domain-containing protein [Paenibacillus sp. GD4]MDQ1911806.1 DUF3298 domain-containing protein [Paenibacillus sp. GD4]
MDMVLDTRIRMERIVTRKLVKPRLEVKYPQVHGLRSRFAEQMINHSILDAVYDLIRTQGYVNNPEMTITGTYETKLHKNGLASFVYENYGYSKGAAHGMTYKSSQTFGLDDGREYKLGDMFLPGSDWVKRINEIIRREFKERDIPMLAEFKSIRPDQPYFLTDRAIGIYFQLYEYTPYVYGFPTFEIPFGQVKDILDPNGPAGRLM